MRQYKYDYTICRDNSPTMFKKACNDIKNGLMYNYERTLIDVDGSTIQIIAIDDKEVVIYDDYDVGAVFALSDFDLEGILDYINVDIS